MDLLEEHDDLFIADVLLDELAKENSKDNDKSVFWEDETPIPKRSRAGEKRKRRQTGGSDPGQSTNVFGESELPAPNTERIYEEIQTLLEDVAAAPTTEASSMSSLCWKSRQRANLQQWTIQRPAIVCHLLASKRLKSGLCQLCTQQAAVIHCRDCLPTPSLCAKCDKARHTPMVLHNRAAMIKFLKPIPPTTCIEEDGDNVVFYERECFLPMMMPSCCSQTMSISTGKKIILIGINGRYDVALPACKCDHCGSNWSVGLGDLIEGGYWPGTTTFDTVYTLDLFQTFEELKVTAPAMSRQAFMAMLDHRTKLFGRNGKICGDTFQRAFLEWIYAKFELDKLTEVQHFQCPACTPSMLAVAVDGNRKLYRFKSPPGPKGFFDGVFLAKNEEVSDFVDYVHRSTKHNSSKGRCGTSTWSAARQSSKKSSSKIDEEGVEIAVCRHGILLKGLNMFGGEIYAYAVYLQKEISTLNPTFFCSDIVCKYWPYLQKVVTHCSEFNNLLSMKPFLSVMHAKAHSWMCELQWGGRNQKGAGTTAGEEVEQVNSFLSRAALCSKYMSEGARTDMLTVHAICWNKRKKDNLDRALAKRYTTTLQRIEVAANSVEEFKQEKALSQDTVQQWMLDVQQWTTCTSQPNDFQGTIESLYLGIKQRKTQLYRQNDSNKRRHQLRKKVADEKKSLEQAILHYNESNPESEQLPCADDVLAEDNFKWPWECDSNMTMKKQLYDKVMLLRRLKEEEVIVLEEMKQHVQYLTSAVDVLKCLCDNELYQGYALTESGREGLQCLLRQRLSEVHTLLMNARSTYKKVLGQNTSFDTDFADTDKEDDSTSCSSSDEDDSA